MMNNAVRSLFVLTLALSISFGGCGDNTSNETILEDATVSSDTESSDAVEDSVSDPCLGIDCGTGGECNAGKCECNAGYELNADSHCADVDECLTDNGGCGDATYWSCTNTDGSNTCADIDECAADNGGCGENAQCANQAGAAVLCTCKPGFIYNPEDACVPTPACQFVVCEVNSHCEEGDCLCDAGYEADTDGNCADVDECLTDNGGCGDATYWSCTNTDGSSTCADIDECATSNGGCGENAQCANQAGAAVLCTCKPGFIYNPEDACVPDCGSESFSYSAVLSGEPSTLSIWIADQSDATVQINGNDSGGPVVPFQFYWGDGQTTSGWFPQDHVYADTGKNYLVEVTATYAGGAVSSDITVVRFVPPVIVQQAMDPTLEVTIPDHDVALGTHLYAPPVLSHYADSEFDQVSRQDIEYVLSLAAELQYNYANEDVFLVNGEFDQVVLYDPSMTGGLSSLWFTEPVSFRAASGAMKGTIDYSSFFHEMGHNVSLNSPADYYFGGKTDGNANAIFSESLAQIFAHVTAYDLVHKGAELGLSCDLVFDIQVSALSSVAFLHKEAQQYIASGMPFASWNDPATPLDETLPTFMTIAHVFFQHAEAGASYSEPLERMMALLQTFDEVKHEQWQPTQTNATADTFRATFMTAALSYAFETSLVSELQDLAFPVDAALHDQLVASVD